jgi:ABC-type Na+ transport system ATPase subunit NatA
VTSLKSFAIDGLAGRSKLIEVELDDSLNVFWGLNGTGKTTLLRILDSALQGDATFLHHAALQRASVSFYSTVSI